VSRPIRLHPAGGRIRRALRWPAAALLAACLCASAASAQAPAYARAPGDTLHYREVWERVIQTPGAPRKVQRQDAILAVAFAAGDTARAWYDGLRLEEADGAGPPRTADGVAGLAFVLAFGARGVDSTLAAPAFPPEVREVADLRWQFWDFFPRLPAGPLGLGTAWADTLVRRRMLEGGGGEVHSADTRVAAYRVVGDSTIDSIPVLVVEVRSETNGVLGGRLFGLEVRGASREAERGRFYFDAARGVLVRRVRTATGAVELTYPTANGPRTIRRADEYAATIDLLTGVHR
jgi:hypothetical protein